MALVKCHECNALVSTEAAACQVCGAKPRKVAPVLRTQNLSWVESFFVLVILIALVVAWRMFFTGVDPVAELVAEPIAGHVEAPSRPERNVPDHYYVWRDGDQYGYQRELGKSEFDRGDAAAPLFVIRHTPHRNADYEFFSVDGGITEIFSCNEPCEMVQSNGTRGPRVLPAPEGSVLWAVVQDMRPGRARVALQSPPQFTDQHEPDAQMSAHSTIQTPALYAEYAADPLAADAKYAGRRVNVTGSVIAANFADAGIGHIRMVSADGGGSGTIDAVLLCFTESCENMRRPTVTDDQFKTVKVGSLVSATCTAEPAKLDRPSSPNLVGVSLSKCTMP